MNGLDFIRLLDERPFRPFRVTLSDGRAFDVMHPELAIVGLSVVVIGLQGTSATDRRADRLVTVSLSHIMQAETLETAPPSGRT